jgi:hypothetical protein
MRKARRKISHGKMYGFHPWQDQVDAVDLIVKETGVSESIVLRKLLDEALVARRRLIADQEVANPSERKTAKSSTTLEDLILRIIKQNSTSLRMQDITLALVQETLAETRAGRNLDWEQVAGSLEEQGLNQTQIEQRFKNETEAAKDFAYGVAQSVKTPQEQ